MKTVKTIVKVTLITVLVSLMADGQGHKNAEVRVPGTVKERISR